MEDNFIVVKKRPPFTNCLFLNDGALAVFGKWSEEDWLNRHKGDGWNQYDRLRDKKKLLDEKYKGTL